MKKLILCGLLLMMSAWAWTQEVKWGPLQKERASMIASAIVSHHSDRTIVLKSKGFPGYVDISSKPELELLSAGFVTTLSERLNPAFEGKSLKAEFCFEIDGQIYVFCSFLNRELDRRFLFAQQVNANSLQLQGNLKKIAELSTESHRGAGSFNYAISRDSSQILIYANTYSKKNEPEKYGLFVIDSEMQSRWNKEVTLPYSEREFEVRDFSIDNDGNAFLLGTKGRAKGEPRRKGVPNYEYRILSYNELGSEVNEYEVSLGDKFLTDMRIDVSPKKDIVCAGFYSERGTFSIKGTYYLRIDRKTKDIEKISSKEFGIDFITMNFTQRQEKKAKKREANGQNVEMYEYDLRDIIPRADGGAVLLAEQFFIRVVCTYNASTHSQTCRTYYYYNDVIVVSIDKNGDIEWNTKVPKRQVTINDGGYYSGYVPMITNEALYLVYNDHIKNLDPNLKQGQYSNFSLRDKNGIVVLAKIDASGNVTRKALFPNTEIEAITVPKLCKQINRKEMLLYAKRRKGSQFGLVSF